MKNTLIKSFALGAFATFMTLSFGAKADMLRVVIAGIEGDTGEIEVQLYDKEGWLNLDHPTTQVKRVPLTGMTNGAVSTTFFGLAPGDYAIGVYHDQDMSGKLETGFMWAPKEGWAFSNNVVPSFGPPSYEKAKVTVTETGAQTGMVLDYP